ncbi:MAG: lamin tail domain-containing protein [Patescibacteria group bacterium]|jgi:hypothetical protein
MKRVKCSIIIIWLLIGQAGLFVPRIVKADSAPSVVINELMWMGSSASSSDEWIELRNLTDQPVDLSNWRLTRKSGGQDTAMLAIPTGISISANGFFLISNFSGDSAQSTLGIAPDVVNTAVSLVNSDLQIKLYTATNELIDTADDGSGVPLTGAYTSGSVWKSMERDVQVADGTLSTSWHTADASINFDAGKPELGTPGAPNSDPNTPPTVKLSGPTSGVVNESLNFDGSESSDVDGDPLQFNWDFGDGNSSTLETPTHSFASAGAFNVKLSVFDGRDQAESQISVVITSAPTLEPPAPAPSSAPIQIKVYSRSIIINEVLPNPTGDDLAEEFIELYNNAADRVDLAGWKLSDTGKSYTIGNGLDSTVVEPNGYFVVPRRVSGIALNNTTTETVRLFTPDDTLINEITYPVPAPEGQSYGRINTDWQWCPTPTPGLANTTAGSDELDATDLTPSTPSKSDTVPITTKKEASTTKTASGDVSNRVWLTELLPNPSGSDTENEYIEITNFDTRPINLLGWKLTDQTTTFVWKKAVVIAPLDSLAIYRPESKISLNNSTEQIFLVAPNGKIVNGVTYSKAPEDLSWSRVGPTVRWAWSAESTPGDTNEIVVVENDTAEKAQSSSSTKSSKEVVARTITVAEFKTLPSRTAVTIEGVITVAADTLGKRTAYLEDTSGGIQITWPTSFDLSLAIGDSVRASGTVSISQGEHRLAIKTADQLTVVSKDTPLQPIELTQAPTEDQYNRLVSITGSLISQETTGMVVKSGEQVFTVLFKKTAKLEVPDSQPGQAISVTGLLTNGTNGVAILPRTSDDIKTAEVKGASTDDGNMSNTNNVVTPTQNSISSVITLSSMAILGFGVAIYMVLRRRRMLKQNMDSFK